MHGASPTLGFPTSFVSSSVKQLLMNRSNNFTVHVHVLFIPFSLVRSCRSTYNCAYSCTNVAKHIIISIWCTICYLLPHADMILTGLFAAVLIWQASLYNVLFHGAEPQPVQPEQATSEEGQSELVTGRE